MDSVVNPCRSSPLAVDVIESRDGPLQKEINHSPFDESILNISLTDLVPVDFTYFEAGGETVAPMLHNTISGEVREDFVTDVRTNDQMEAPTFSELTNRRGEESVTEDRTDDQMTSTTNDDEMTSRVVEKACLIGDRTEEPMTNLGIEETVPTSTGIEGQVSGPGDDQESAHITPKVKLGRAQWNKNIQKRLRQEGKEYTGRNYDGNTFTAGIKEERKLGERCKCQKPSTNRCKDVTDEQRGIIFKNVWKMTWEEKKIFVLSMSEMGACKRRRVDETNSKKKASFQYYLKVNGENHKVCFNFFLSTTGLKETWLRDVLKKHRQTEDDGGVDEQKKTKSTLSERRQELKNFLQALPKMESHYCRKSSTKLYLEPVFQTVSAVYKVYANSAERALSRTVFEEEFDAMNLSIFRPRKDLCDICFAYNQGNVREEVFIEHRARKDRAQREKSNDKDNQNPKVKVITVDLQSVLLSPMCKASALYYKTKLCVHNYTIFDLKTRDVCCYIWNESEGSLSANDFASCLTDYLQECVNDHETFIIFSDGCTAQNRNATLASALSYFAIKNNVTVIQKILEKGHTQMEVDSVHSCIERQIKNKIIQVPSDYAVHAQNARKNPRPYRAKYLDHTFFRDFTQINTMKSIRPGRNGGDPVVTNLRALLYKPCGSIQFKLDFDDTWSNLPLKRNESTSIIKEPSPLYQTRLKISQTKYQHLQELKSIIHTDHHHFYDSLPH